MNIPKNKRLAKASTLLAISLFSSGCSTSHFGNDTIKRSPVDTPDHFMVGLPNNDTLIEPKPNDGCRNPMVDPRNGNRLQLIRSSDRQGDYNVPKNSYGVTKNELLRIDCTTGRAVGIVKK